MSACELAKLSINIHDWHNEFADGSMQILVEDVGCRMVCARGAHCSDLPAPVLRLKKLFNGGVYGHDTISDSDVGVVGEVLCEVCAQPRIDEHTVRNNL